MKTSLMNTGHVSIGLNAEPATAESAASPRRIWITWEKQRRNATISQALGCKLFEFDLHYPSVIRYPVALLRTLMTFVRERPSLIFVQNPSMILSAFAAAYGRLLRIPVIVDAHNAGIEPLWRKPLWQATLARFILRTASLTILSNASLANRVRSSEGGIGSLAVLPDPIPQLHRPPVEPRLLGRRNILYMCSWAEDEPYLQAIEAARLLPPDTFVYITGRSGGRLDRVDLPPNVVLTGYVDEQTYIALLFACDIVLDLTTWQDCLLCGGYEAVSAERTMVLSGTEALRSYFHKGAVYTDNTPEDLAKRIQEALSAEPRLREDVRALKSRLMRDWQADRTQLEEMLKRLLSE